MGTAWPPPLLQWHFASLQAPFPTREPHREAEEDQGQVGKFISHQNRPGLTPAANRIAEDGPPRHSCSWGLSRACPAC